MPLTNGSAQAVRSFGKTNMNVDQRHHDQLFWDQSSAGVAAHGPHFDLKASLGDRLDLNIRLNPKGDIMSKQSDIQARGRFDGVKTRAKIDFTKLGI